MKIFTYDDNFFALASCIYSAWEYSINHKDEDIKLQKHLPAQMDLFSEIIYIKTDVEKANKVIKSIKTKLSMQSFYTVYLASLHCKDTGDDIYRFLRLAFKCGRDINYMLGEEIVMKLTKLQKSVSNEIHCYMEITRFIEVFADVFIAHIEPKHNIISELREHFQNRMPSLNWIIIEPSRNLALVHPKDGDCYLQTLTEDELQSFSKINDIKGSYSKLWKTFFDHIAIKERENLKLQRNKCPLRRRKYMTEHL